ncbi:SUN domain-containing ossification factor-like isoform X2 [Limulus polyphemus]|uniref:SUN domain-containing ossification factor-like isoform X2 n=1 Tax=Limulus polyphemus TaxID=6850 RepID=A0ABM1RYB9_LIMPO|nr:SUN domain-containing ossification factor-like isoform X2 [Limulus polyphemus]
MKIFKVLQVSLCIFIEFLIRGWCTNSNRVLPQNNTEAQNELHESSQLPVQLENEELGDVSGETFTTNSKLVASAAKDFNDVENHPFEEESKDIIQLPLSSDTHPDITGSAEESTVRESVGELSATKELFNHPVKHDVENQLKSVKETSDLKQEMQPLQTKNSSQFADEHSDGAKYLSKDEKPTRQTLTDEEEENGLHSVIDKENQDKNIQGVGNKMQQKWPVEFEKGVKTDQEKSTDTPRSEPDVMPSFDEWKKKMLAEQEREDFVPGKKLAAHKRKQNYASYKCGAKIMGSNPEAEGKSRILSEMMDEYMLNPCKAKIWFVVELCESIQANQVCVK